MLQLSHFLLVGMILFIVGVIMVLTRRNVIMALMGFELMLNAASVNFVAFGYFDRIDLDGQIAALFIIVLAVAETAVALAIILNVYRRYRTIRLDELERIESSQDTLS